jgi:hypothetical protein
MTDQPIDQPSSGSARAALAQLRPQQFGDSNPGRVSDPLVEPLWAGVRVLAAVDDHEVALIDQVGNPIDEHPAIAAALAAASLAERLVVDGYLTKMVVRDQAGVFVPMDDLPSSAQLMARPLLGIRRTRAEDVTKELEAARIARTFGPEDVVSFVAVDLLWLDGESLLDVPLLERRRLLESALGESELIRRGIFVRPPLEAWLGSWRALGFTGISLKAANSRYQPGGVSDDWASAPMPRR